MCIVLVLVVVRFGLWTMTAELCFSVDDFILFFFSNFSNTAADTANCFVFFSGFVPLLLLPARRQAGRDFCLVCIVLVLVAVRFASWTMMAELCSWLMIYDDGRAP